MREIDVRSGVDGIVQLPDLLARAAAEYPGRIALDFMGRKWSYAQVQRLAGRAAAGLRRLGVEPGDRVCLCLPNTPYYVILYFAILRAGGVVVNMNPLYTEREMRQLIEDSGAKIACVPDLPMVLDKMAAIAKGGGLMLVRCPTAGVLPVAKGLLYRLLRRREIGRVPGGVPHIGFGRLIRSDETVPAPGRSPDDLAVLQYTGGTTGIPKGAMLSHANLIANSSQMAAHDQGCPAEAERVMAVLPMFHVFALTTVLNYSVLTGAEMVLLPRFEMKGFLAAMSRTRPERLFVVPTILGALNALDVTALPAMEQIRLCVSGGAPLPAEVRAAFEARTGVRVLEGYGLTEASPIITCNPTSGAVRDGSAGVAFPQTVIEIRSLDDPAMPVAPGERGEVCVRGPQVMLGYWQRPDETADVLEAGLLRTGDVGHLDADGYLFLTDRIKDVILCGGYNVYPRVIEEALYAHPDIADATVIGVPDSYRGEAPKAFVMLKTGLTDLPADLEAHLAERLNKIELPREIEIRDELPKTLIGKFSKKDLREQAVRA